MNINIPATREELMEILEPGLVKNYFEKVPNDGSDLTVRGLEKPCDSDWICSCFQFEIRFKEAVYIKLVAIRPVRNEELYSQVTSEDVIPNVFKEIFETLTDKFGNGVFGSGSNLAVCWG